jgi:RimJ/RimL family protein N-acetyltransferase
MSSRVFIRPLNLDDYLFAFRLRNDAGVLRWFHSSVGTNYLRHSIWFAKRFLFRRNSTLIACIENQPVGICYLSNDSKKGVCFLSVNVSISFRRIGVGKQLLVHAIEVAKRIGIKELKASIHVKNLASLSLFEQHGFVQTTNGAKFVDFILMEKTLN